MKIPQQLLPQRHIVPQKAVHALYFTHVAPPLHFAVGHGLSKLPPCGVLFRKRRSRALPNKKRRLRQRKIVPQALQIGADVFGIKKAVNVHVVTTLNFYNIMLKPGVLPIIMEVSDLPKGVKRWWTWKN